MKTALVLDRFDPSIGGLERWAFDFVRWLMAAGHEVHVVAADFAESLPLPSANRHLLPSSRGRLERAAAAAAMVRSIAAAVIHDTGTGWCFDVFHPHFGSRIADRRGNLRAEAWYRRPLRAIRLGRDRDRFTLERRQLDVDRGVVVACSRVVRDDFERLHGVDPDRIRVVPNGVDPVHFHPGRRERERPAVRARLGIAAEVVFLFAAHNWKLKGLATAIAALGRLGDRARDARLLVVGRGDVARWQLLARAAGVADRCRFLGPVDDVAPYYAAADVYIQPTFYDPCSLTVLEAWASGLPVITSRQNGAAELMTAGCEGLIVEDPASAEEVAWAMESLLKGAARVPMESAARALAEENSLATSFGRILDIYHWVLERRQREVAA